MKPSEPPAEPMVATITISVVVILVFDRKKNAKKNSAAIVGPSSITPNDSVRYEFIAHSTRDRTSPTARLRAVTGGRGGLVGTGSLIRPILARAGRAAARGRNRRYWAREVH